MSKCQDAHPCISPQNSILKLYKAPLLYNARDMWVDAGSAHKITSTPAFRTARPWRN